MSANRRGFLCWLAGLPGVATVLNWTTPTALASQPGQRDVYNELGVRPLINAAGTYTALGGSLMPHQVVEAITAAAGKFVHLLELQKAVGKRIATLVGCEAALVTAGAASALTLGTAACVAGKDADKIRKLPDTTGMKNEVIIQKAHRYGYDHAVRNVGVKLIEVVTRQDLERAVNPRTAMLLFYNDFDPVGQIKVEEFAQLGQQLNVPTFNDAAADVPPVEHFARYFQMGYDLVTFSGGKGLRGPQSAGLLLGRQHLIEAAALNNNPHTDSIGRTNKVGKEELVGMWAALEHYLKQDHKALWREWEQRVQTIARLVGEVAGVRVEPFVPPIANHVPHVRIAWSDQASKLTPAALVQQLRAGDPPIEIRPVIANDIQLAVWMLEPGEDAIVGRRIRDILKKDNNTRPRQD